MAADGDGVFAFDKEISKMLIGPFVQRVQNAVGHQPMFTRQGIELGDRQVDAEQRGICRRVRSTFRQGQSTYPEWPADVFASFRCLRVERERPAD